MQYPKANIVIRCAESVNCTSKLSRFSFNQRPTFERKKVAAVCLHKHILTVSLSKYSLTLLADPNANSHVETCKALTHKCTHIAKHTAIHTKCVMNSCVNKAAALPGGVSTRAAEWLLFRWIISTTKWQARATETKIRVTGIPSTAAAYYHVVKIAPV